MTSEDDDVTNAQAEVADRPAPEQAHMPDPRLLDFDTLQKLRKAGFPKPDGVGWPDWLGLKKLSHRHMMIALMAASGKTAREIHRETGMTETRLSIILNCQRMKREIARVRDEYYGKNVQAKFQAMLDPAVEFWNEKIRDPNADARLKHKIAEGIFNRVLGKPKETLEVKNTSVRELFAFLDKLQSGEKSLDFLPSEPQPKIQSNPEIIEATATLVETKPKNEFDAIDDWIEKNVPKTEGIGKRETKADG